MKAQKTHDKLGRRSRWAPPRRIEGDNHSLSKPMIQALVRLHWFGILSTDVWFRVCRVDGIYTNLDSFRKAANVLRNHFQLIDSLPKLNYGENPNAYDLPYRVNELGEGFLKNLDERHRANGTRYYSEHVPNPYGALEHQMVLGCTMASDYVLARENNIPVTLQHELCEQAGVGLSMDTPSGKLTPDGAMLFHFKDKPLFTPREIDKATEPGRSTDQKRESWEKKINKYDYVIGEGTPEMKRYKAHFKLPIDCGALVQVITVPNVNSGRVTMQQKIIKNVAEKYKDRERKCPFIGVLTTWAFGYDFHAPKFCPTLDLPFERAGYPPFQLIPSEASTVKK